MDQENDKKDDETEDEENEISFHFGKLVQLESFARVEINIDGEWLNFSDHFTPNSIEESRIEELVNGVDIGLGK